MAPVKPPNPGVKRFNTDIGDAVDRLRQHIGLPPRKLPGPLAELEMAELGVAHNKYIAWMNANPNATLVQKIEELDRIKSRMGIRWRLD